MLVRVSCCVLTGTYCWCSYNLGTCSWVLTVPQSMWSVFHRNVSLMFLYVPSQRDWSDHIYVKGCIAALEDWLPGNLYTVAIIFIVISLLQVQTLQFSTVLHPPGVCVLVCVCWWHTTDRCIPSIAVNFIFRLTPHLACSVYLESNTQKGIPQPDCWHGCCFFVSVVRHRGSLLFLQNVRAHPSSGLCRPLNMPSILQLWPLGYLTGACLRHETDCGGCNLEYSLSQQPSLIWPSKLYSKQILYEAQRCTTEQSKHDVV